MHSDANEYAEADTQLLAINISDDELERAAIATITEGGLFIGN